MPTWKFDNCPAKSLTDAPLTEGMLAEVLTKVTNVFFDKKVIEVQYTPGCPVYCMALVEDCVLFVPLNTSITIPPRGTENTSLVASVDVANNKVN